MSACPDTRPGSTHASRTAWVAGCTCPASADAHHRDVVLKRERYELLRTYNLHYRHDWDDVDPISVYTLIIIGGHFSTLAERQEVIRRLVRNGWTSAQIAEHMGLTTRTVERYRSRLKAAA